MAKMNPTQRRRGWLWAALVLISTLLATSAFAAPLPGGTLDPLLIPKYVQPLVIPPVMPATILQPDALDSAGAPISGAVVPAAQYNIAVRQFSQQILPGGIWDTITGRTDAFPPTPVWSYGPEEDMPAFDAAGNSTYVAPIALGQPGANFNYPAFTMESIKDVPTTVRWINDLKNPVDGTFLPHILTGTVDQTLHWANPAKEPCDTGLGNTDCATTIAAPYAGPVPIVTHVHGAHVNPESDGYPEAWWLANASDIPAGYATTGTLYTQNNLNIDIQAAGDALGDFDPVGGAAFYTYENTQPATTLWYHDHSLGMTRLNVYAGPAGFWLVRGGPGSVAPTYDNPTTTAGAPAVLPGPAPVLGDDPNFNAATRTAIREIPIAIQDRSFNADGTLFYPNGRAFFDGFLGPYIGDPTSDINPIWNPEAFFNTMVVNGTTWPVLNVAPERYRLRLLSGSNSRFINLSMFEVLPNAFVDRVDAWMNKIIARIALRSPARAAAMQARLLRRVNTRPVRYGAEIPFYQIGGDQGFLKNVVKIQTGLVATLPGDGTIPAAVLLPDPMQALLMAPAERADVIVDFSGLAPGTIVRMINTAPDAPFGGFPDIPADPATSGQVMQFVVGAATGAIDPSTPPVSLVLDTEPANPNTASLTRPLSLNEEESLQVCVTVGPTGALTTVASFPVADLNIAATCAALTDATGALLGAVPQAPKAALLGRLLGDPSVPGSPLVGVPQMWKDPVTENPAVGATENWDFYNVTVDGHPIHMHLVRYEIVHRQLLDIVTNQAVGAIIPPLPTESGKKDTVLAYPGEVTRVKATFDLPGLYVWHCHIVEHEDNEMMRPFYVGTMPAGFPVGLDPTANTDTY